MPPADSLRPRLATRANALTAARLALAPVLVWAVCAGAHALALACFVLAVGSDLADTPASEGAPEQAALQGGANAFALKRPGRSTQPTSPMAHRAT